MNKEHLQSYVELLKLFPNAYDEKLNTGTDEEVLFYFRKLASMKKDEKFNPLFQLEEENRNFIRQLLEQRLSDIENNKDDSLANVEVNTDVPTIATIVPVPSRVLFSKMLVPINGNTNKTLQIIKDALDEVNLKHDLFAAAPSTKNNKNPKGFNDSLAAMISFFHEHNYFQSTYSKEEILEAHLYQYGNKIPKYNGNFNFLSIMRNKEKEYPIKAYYLKFRHEK